MLEVKAQYGSSNDKGWYALLVSWGSFAVFLYSETKRVWNRCVGVEAVFVLTVLSIFWWFLKCWELFLFSLYLLFQDCYVLQRYHLSFYMWRNESIHLVLFSIFKCVICRFILMWYSYWFVTSLLLQNSLEVVVKQDKSNNRI